VVNLGLEGVMLIGAVTGFVATVHTGSAALGVVAAALAGGLFNLIFAFLVVSRRANQLATGLALMFAGVGLSALIVLGSTNLFAASRRFGPRLVCGRLGTALHLTPAGVARAQRWFARWGPLAIGVSRYVPGLRWGMAVACGTLGVSYRTFWASTAISASIWAGGLLTLGVTLGDAVGRVIAEHAWMGLLLPLPATAVVTTGVIRLVVMRRSAAPSASPSI